MITVAQVTDTHLFASDTTEWNGINPDRTLTQVIRKIKHLNPLPDMILLTGDLSQDETPESYQRLRDKFESLGIPIYYLPGNHDRPELMGQILQNKPFLSDKIFKMGQWRFILLDSTVKGQPHGYLASDTISFINSELSQDDSPTLIAVHHHPLLIGSWFMDPMNLHNGSDLIELVKKFKQVKIVIFGHIHSVFESEIAGVSYLGCPSSCLQLKHFEDDRGLVIDDSPPGFRLFYLQNDGSFETKIERVDNY
jgi:Icc protein